MTAPVLAPHSVHRYDEVVRPLSLPPASEPHDGSAAVTQPQAPRLRSTRYHKRPWWRMLHEAAAAHQRVCVALFCEPLPLADVARREAEYHATKTTLTTIALTYRLGHKGTLEHARAQQLKRRGASHG